MSPFNAAQNLLQIKWIKKDLKVAPTSSVGSGMGSVKRQRTMTIDGQQDLLLVPAYFGQLPPPLLCLYSDHDCAHLNFTFTKIWPCH